MTQQPFVVNIEQGSAEAPSCKLPVPLDKLSLQHILSAKPGSGRGWLSGAQLTYKALDRGSGGAVFAKAIHCADEGKKASARAVRNALLRAVDKEPCPYIALQHLHASATQPGSIWIVEKWSTATLRQLVGKTAVSEELLRFVACEALAAIERLQKHRIVHGRVTTAAFLVDADGHLQLSGCGEAEICMDGQQLSKESLRADSRAVGAVLAEFALGEPVGSDMNRAEVAALLRDAVDPSADGCEASKVVQKLRQKGCPQPFIDVIERCFKLRPAREILGLSFFANRPTPDTSPLKEVVSFDESGVAGDAGAGASTLSSPSLPVLSPLDVVHGMIYTPVGQTCLVLVDARSEEEKSAARLLVDSHPPALQYFEKKLAQPHVFVDERFVNEVSDFLQ